MWNRLSQFNIGGLVPLGLLVVYPFYAYKHEPLLLSAFLVVVLLCTFLKVIPHAWWSTTKLLGIAFLTIALMIFMHYGLGASGNVVMLLFPLIYVSATAPRELQRFALFVALCAILSTVIIAYDQNFLFTVLGLVGMFFGVRNSAARKEAYRQNQLHLQEMNAAHRQLQKAHDELQEATIDSMRYAALAERVRIAREIHDGLGHRLTSLIIQLQTLEIMLPGDPQGADRALPAILDNSRNALSEVRMAVREWAEDETGLGLVALRGLVTQTAATSHLQIEFQHEGANTDWPVEISLTLYRVLQESLTNIMRHADATRVNVQVNDQEHHVTITVADDGCYNEQSTPLTLGFGMRGIIERCKSLGGTCTFTQDPPHGLRVSATLPFVQQKQEERLHGDEPTDSHRAGR